MCYVYPCWKGLSVFHFWLFSHLPLDTNVMAIQMGINILDTFAGGWHKKLGPIEQRVCFNTLLRHSCNPFLESCASWIFCWPSRQVNNNFLIFRSFSKRRSIVEIKFLFLYCCFRFLLIFISDLFLKTINRRDWLECILLHDPPFPAADPSDPPTAAKQPSGKVTMIMLVKNTIRLWFRDGGSTALLNTVYTA